MKDFLEKLKNNQKTQAAVICSVVGAVLVLTAAVTIPVALRNRVKVEAEAESAAITAEAEITDSSSVTITEPETEVTSEITTESITAETTAQAANNNASAGKNTSANTNKGGGSNKSGGSDSSAQKPNGGSSGGQSQQKPPVQANKNQWTQEKIDSLISEMKRYATNNGLIIDNSLTAIGTSWSNPIGVGNGKSYDKAKADIKYDIDELLDGNPYHINIFAKITAASDGTARWEIYIVY